ncbi:MAG TPA: hypothetical protein VFN83_05035 [Gemmatimonadales bacterium]|jgi:hypothetical protein|nr:hypothetical protein [Gemmatimonadales bacterium]
MGIYPQPNLWQCGPFALKHALVVQGILRDEREISRIAGTHWWAGTDELQLGRAARKYDCDLLMVRRNDPERARKALVAYLRREIPVLLCVDEWSHWLTAVKAEAGKFILLDSRVKRVVEIASWPQLRRMWVYHEEDEYDDGAVRTIFDLHPVVPRFKPKTHAQFSLARARALQRDVNRRLAQRWDEYLEDLLAICRPRTTRTSKVFSLGEFIRRHGAMIVETLDYWHGSVDRHAVRQILNNLHFVADTYGLVIHDEDEKRAIAGISTLLTLWAAGEFGATSVYGPYVAPRRRRRAGGRA